MQHLIDAMTMSQLIVFVQLHTLDDNAHLRVGTNPITKVEINYAKKRIRMINYAAYTRDLKVKKDKS